MHQNQIPVFTGGVPYRPAMINTITETMWATSLQEREVSNSLETDLPETVVFDGKWCVPQRPAFFPEGDAGQTPSLRHHLCWSVTGV